MNYDQKQIEQKIFNYIVNNTHYDITKVKTDTMLFKEGVFDSMGFILLLEYIEEKFQIRAFETDLVEENFESVFAITNYIQRKIALKES